MRKFVYTARSLLQHARALSAQRATAFNLRAFSRIQKFPTLSVLTGSACLACSAAAILSCGGQEDSSLVEASLADKIKSNYAARIATYSSPEKVFLSYASKTRDGEKFMTMNDFIDSLCPFEKKRTNKGTPSKLARRVFSMVDSDGDGLISFQEYIFFNALLQIPRQSIETAFRMFDSDGSGTVDRSEFIQMMSVIESHNPLGGSAQTKAVSSSAATQRRKDEEKKGSEADLTKFECFFGSDGSKKLELETFRAFILALQEGVLEVEFHRMDSGGKGLLTAEELSLSITSHCNPKAHEGFVAKASVLGARYPTHLFSMNDFKQLFEVLGQISPISKAVEVLSFSASTASSSTDALPPFRFTLWIVKTESNATNLSAQLGPSLAFRFPTVILCFFASASPNRLFYFSYLAAEGRLARRFMGNL
jgi:Ca2+-binding EF-hand superfamily protein